MFRIFSACDYLCVRCEISEVWVIGVGLTGLGLQRVHQTN
jgi:hypothetical protein